MNNKEYNDDYLDWIRRASGNLFIAKLKKFNQIPTEELLFNAHQASEKALKGLIVFLTFDPPKTHKLTNLYKFLQKFFELPTDIKRACTILDPYAVDIRYLGCADFVSEETYVEAINEAEKNFFIGLTIK
jgi:HEPN domain-containing protein